MWDNTMNIKCCICSSMDTTTKVEETCLYRKDPSLNEPGYEMTWITCHTCGNIEFRDPANQIFDRSNSTVSQVVSRFNKYPSLQMFLVKRLNSPSALL